MLLLSTTHEISHLIFFFNDTATTEIYTLSLHDALPILRKVSEKMGAAQSWSYGRSSKAKDGPQTLRRWYPRIRFEAGSSLATIQEDALSGTETSTIVPFEAADVM